MCISRSKYRRKKSKERGRDVIRLMEHASHICSRSLCRALHTKEFSHWHFQFRNQNLHEQNMVCLHDVENTPNNIFPETIFCFPNGRAKCCALSPSFPPFILKNAQNAFFSFLPGRSREINGFLLCTVCSSTN